MLINEHIDSLVEEKGNQGLLIARKHISWTCKDFPNANELRKFQISWLTKFRTWRRIRRRIQRRRAKYSGSQVR